RTRQLRLKSEIRSSKSETSGNFEIRIWSFKIRFGFRISSFGFSQSMPILNAILAGTGSSVPERRLTNDDLSKMVDTNDEWITQRTGIKERRIAAAEDTTATLGAAAARRAIESAGIAPKDLDLIIVSTVTPERCFPSPA